MIYRILIQAYRQFFNKFLLPHHCLLCQHISDRALCKDCEQSLAWLQDTCPKCSYPIDKQTISEPTPCPACFKNKFYFTRTIALFHYEEPISSFIKELKFNGQLAVATWLGQILSEHVEKIYSNELLPQLIIPMPLHVKRLRQRGYNQALEIARIVSKCLDITLQPNVCRRIRHTRPQAQLSALQREKNIQQAFEIRGAINVGVGHVAIIDDVMTTGSTCNVLSQLLYEQGIKQIDIWCCARAVHSKNMQY